MASQMGLPRCPEGHVTAYMTVTPREPGLAQWASRLLPRLMCNY